MSPKDSIYATDLQAELPAWVMEHHFIFKCLADKLYSVALGTWQAPSPSLQGEQLAALAANDKSWALEFWKICTYHHKLDDLPVF